MSKERDDAKRHWDETSGGKNLDLPGTEEFPSEGSPVVLAVIVLLAALGGICLIVAIIIGFNYLFPV